MSILLGVLGCLCLVLGAGVVLFFLGTSTIPGALERAQISQSQLMTAVLILIGAGVMAFVGIRLLGAAGWIQFVHG